jgi:hypothetical protein
MNIAKLQSQLESVPDQALIGYVQSPDGQVPSYLALAELSRRKQIRSGGAQQQAPTQTVAEQEMTSAEPGIAALPVDPNMFSEQSMAAGGIVSFAGGGSSDITQAEFDRLSPQQQQQYLSVHNQRTGLANTFKAGLAPFGYVAQGIANTGTAMRNFAQPLRKIIGTDSPTAGPKTAGDYKVKYSPQLSLTEYRDTLQSPTLKTPTIPPTGEAPKAVTPGSEQPQGSVPSQAMTGGQSRTPAMGGISNLSPQGVSSTPMEFDRAGFDALMPSEADRSIAVGQEEFRNALGADPSRAKLEEKLAGMQGRADKEEGQAPWMALAEAGLTMAAGDSPFALKNIAAGGTQGLKSLAAAKERASAAEEKRFAIEADLAKAQRAEQVAATTYGADSKQAAEKNALTVGLSRQEAAAKLKSDNANLKMQEKEIDLRARGIDKQIAAAERSANKQIQSMENTAAKDRLTLQFKGLSDTAATLQDQLSDLYVARKDTIDPDTIAGINKRINSFEPQLARVLTRLENFTGDSGALTFGKMTTRPSK